MGTNFIKWAGFNGEAVYTTECRSFSFLENSRLAVEKVIDRGVPLDLNNGESYDEINIKLNQLFDDLSIDQKHFFKGIHKVYTNVKIK